MDNIRFQELVLEQFNQLYKRLDAVDSRLDKIDMRLDKIDSRLDKIDIRLDKINANQVRIENELTEKIQGLYDFCKVQNGVNEQIIHSLDRLEAKIDVLQMEIASIRRVK